MIPARTPARVAAVIRRWLPRKLRAHRIFTGPIRGARIVTSWHDYPAGIAGLTEKSLIAWFAQHVALGTTWLDVGAHYGYTAIALSQLVGKEGRVFAFEPMRVTATCVSKTRVLNHLDQLTVIPCGLGRPDSVTSVGLPTVRGMADGTIGETEHPVEAIEVARFDWLWPQINAGQTAIHGIKIDVQGMELDVLGGMERTLTAMRPKLVIELHRGVDRAAVLELLRSVGYSAAPVPVQPAAGESTAQLLDDRSYAFVPNL
jgi:FkbM family methyltransferase